MKETIRAYLHILKPGITISNTVSAVAGYLLGVAVVETFDVSVLLGLAVGIAAIIGSACVANNVLDEKIDAKMKRTRRREVVTGAIPKRSALLYALVLAIAGFATIFALTNVLTGSLGVVAYVSYVVLYGIAKRTTIWSTVIGTLPGALPLVAGYTAITGRLDAATAVLFAMMVFWQLGHFYAIAMFRRDDYAAAGLPVWSVRKGLVSTKRQLFLFVWLFFATAPLLTVFGYTGKLYAVAMTGMAAIWIVHGFKRHARDDTAWSRRMFFVSLFILLTMCLLVAIGGFLP